MSAIKPVTPDEAAAAWRSIPNPSARRVAKALTQAGRRVHFSTVARWRSEGWRPVSSGSHPIEAARQSLEVAATPAIRRRERMNSSVKPRQTGPWRLERRRARSPIGP
jgi:hypothetical protein